MDQVSKVTEVLQQEVDRIGATEKEAWRGMVERGELQADPEAEFGIMRELAAQDDALPTEMRDMVKAHE